MQDQWTKPFCNVTYRVTGKLQLTVTAYGRFAVAVLFVKGAGFSNNPEATFYKRDHNDPVRAAKQWLESYAARLEPAKDDRR
jgi:hypothetical protein